MTIQFNLLKKKVSEQTVEFIEVNTLVIHYAAGYVFDNLLERNFQISPEASITLRNLTGVIEYDENKKHKLVYQTSYKQVKTWIYEGEHDEIVKLINSALERYEKLVVSVVDNTIVGFYRNYNGIQHTEILNEIKESGLANRVMPSYVNDTDLLVNLNINDKETKTPYNFNLQVYNNLNSNKGLGYQLYFRFKDLEFTVDFEADSRRHLSKVNEVFEVIKNHIQKMQELNIPKTLNETSVQTFMNFLYKTVDKNNKNHVKLLSCIENFVNTENPANSSELLVFLGNIANERGFKGIAGKIGQSVIDDIFGVK